jgi:hypothetical protein
MNETAAKRGFAYRESRRKKKEQAQRQSHTNTQHDVQRSNVKSRITALTFNARKSKTFTARIDKIITDKKVDIALIQECATTKKPKAQGSNDTDRYTTVGWPASYNVTPNEGDESMRVTTVTITDGPKGVKTSTDVDMIAINHIAKGDLEVCFVNVYFKPKQRIDNILLSLEVTMTQVEGKVASRRETP